MDQRRPRDGRTVEEIGYYDPNTDPPTVSVNKDRALHWLMNGAIPTDTVSHLFARVGVSRPASTDSTPPAAES